MYENLNQFTENHKKSKGWNKSDAIEFCNKHECDILEITPHDYFDNEYMRLVVASVKNYYEKYDDNYDEPGPYSRSRRRRECCGGEFKYKHPFFVTVSITIIIVVVVVDVVVVVVVLFL